MSVANAAVQQQLLKAAEIIESQIDAELGKLEKPDEGELELIRQRRIAQMKSVSKQRDDWIANGHGEYTEMKDEREFFDVCKKSQRIVAHFYMESMFRCKIFDKHLALLAPKHIETKFIKIDAEKSPFLTGRLNIKVIPTLVIVKDGITTDFLRGFSEMGNTDEFPTEMLEWRLAKTEVIKYTGDLSKPPGGGQKAPKSILGVNPTGKNKKSLRSGANGDSSDDDDW